MLSHEHGVPAPWRLFTVIQRCGRREAFRDEVPRVEQHRRQTSVRQIPAILLPKAELAPEW